MKWIALIVVLAGCAAQQHAQRLSSPALCYVAYSGTQTDKIAADRELQARGFKCTRDDVLMGQQDYNAYASRHQQQSNDALNAYLLYQATRPQPPPQVTCSTTPLGAGYSTTTCR